MGQVSRSTNLACIWRVKMEREEGINEGGAMRMGIKNEERNAVAI